jgi:putative peptide zinc metalloprotease protein
MSADCCLFPPRLAADVEITRSTESGSTSFIIGSASAGRYLILGQAEHEVVAMLDGSMMLSAICEELVRRHGATPGPTTFMRFLAKLDEVGILAGERAGRAAQALLPGNQVYLRWSLFNPDRLFGRLVPPLCWIWTRWFFALSVMSMAFTAMRVLMNWPAVSRSAGQMFREHYIAILCAAWLVTISHEFAHGLTSKAFGGRATEVGVLLIYYLLPALYCNVSGIHLIPKRGQRLWVIAAGVYWQLLVATAALLIWFVFSPDSLAGRTAMAFVVASVVDLVFNANPLIKLDGYYFLSQWLRMPNLMDRSRACWRRLFQRVLGRCVDPQAAQFTSRERRILLVFGSLSFAYNLALPVVVVWWAAHRLMDWLQFLGLLLSLVLALAYAWRPLKKMFAAKERDMAKSEFKGRLRRCVPAAMALCLVAGLCIPWMASVGSYGTLVAIAGREAIIRAPENASLLALDVQPGQQVSRGAAIGRMANLDLEEQIAQIRTELARVNADAKRLAGELRVQEQSARTSELQLAQRRREFSYIDSEERQIQAQVRPIEDTPYIVVSNAPAQGRKLPPALAVLQAEVELSGIRLTEAYQQRDRARALSADRLLAHRDLETAEAKASALAFDLAAARERLEAALIEHHRRRRSLETEMTVADSHLEAGRTQAASLSHQVEASRRLSASLQDQLALLESKRAQFTLTSPVAGALFGEDLPRMRGQYFLKGAEICRIAYTQELLARVQVPEQALGDIGVGLRVRLKTRAYPDRLFHAVVSRIGGESELDANGQRSYRAELTVHNTEGLLRQGMTVFVRIDFGRYPIGWLVAHKLKQALRPEIWIL